jgi:hypothetical protein
VWSPPADAAGTSRPAHAANTFPPADAAGTSRPAHAANTFPPADAANTLPPAHAAATSRPAHATGTFTAAEHTVPDVWEASGGTGRGSPEAAPIARPPRKSIWRRPLLIGCVVLALVVVAVAVPLGLSRKSPSKPPPEPPLTAAGLLSRSLGAARATHAFNLQVSEQGTDEFERDTIDFTPHGTSMIETTGSLGSSSLTVHADLVGKIVYLSGGSGLLASVGVSSALAARYADGWVSGSSASGYGLYFGSALSAVQELGILSLTKVTERASSSSVVTLQGGVPKNDLVPGGAVGLHATVTVSASAPYLPTSMTFAESGASISYTYSHWGNTPVVTAPRTATSLALLTAESASGHLSGDQAILQAISVHQSDLPARYLVRLVGYGDQVAGQVTLDLCGSTYASERLRVARRQVAITGPHGIAGSLSTEAVIYTNAAATATAFEEMRKAAASCPAGLVVPPEGPPAIKTTLYPARDSSWPSVPAVQRLVFSSSIKTATSPPETWLTVYLRRGRVLLGIYFNPATARLAVPIAGQRSVEAVVTVLAKRLAAIPSADAK